MFVTVLYFIKFKLQTKFLNYSEISSSQIHKSQITIHIMKGKIYKNKLTSMNNKQQLNTDISSICNPHSPSNFVNQRPLTPTHILSPSHLQPYNTNNINFETNLGFRRSCQNKKHPLTINQLFPQSIKFKNKNNVSTVGRANFIDEIKSNQRPDSKLLKRATSNPNLTSYQELFAHQNREDEDIIKLQQEMNVLNNSSNSILYANNNSKLTHKGFNYHVTSPRGQVPKNTFSQIKAPHFKYTSPLYSLGMNNNVLSHQSQLPVNPFLQASNILNYMQNNQNMQPKKIIGSTDFINAYEKRHKQRISALQSQHQMEKQFMQQQLKQKNQMIEQMRKILKQKQQIIRRLQAQNANISSRSYISFANNG